MFSRQPVKIIRTDTMMSGVSWKIISRNHEEMDGDANGQVRKVPELWPQAKAVSNNM